MGASVTSLGRKKNLSSLLQYAGNPSKKEKCVAVTGINCSDELEKAYLMMNRTRTKMNHSKDVTQAYHVIHSFDKEISKELTEEQMHKIAVEFAEKSFPHCQIIVASHNDKEHFHSHLVINNIDTETGKRIRIDPKDLENMREINDTILKSHELEPINNEYYDSLFRRNNIYSNDPSKLKKGQVNHQQVIQDAIDEVLRDKNVTTFEKFSDTLAKNHDIEVYKFSKNSNKLGYVLYKKEANFYDNREKFIALGKDKASRKIREPYVEKTFSAKKLGKSYELESIEKELDYNLMDYQISNLDSFSKEEQFIILNQKINKTGELEAPFVELDETAQRQFNRKGAHHFMKYDDFLKSVDKHFATSLGPPDDQEYEIKVHLKVNKQTLKSTDHKKVAVKKTEEKQYTSPRFGVGSYAHTPNAQALHHQISKVINDDVKMYRAKKDYEFMQHKIEMEQQRRQEFEMDF
ncbi:relaxase/mobilization nuclease domain-containing protein [Vagococcus zengguangii]|uniref:Relaxase n=1 Tax=Vagococcus zengguangii TaxID=2571750 RepID=A0A4D7CTX4_9ENTE|nr:relaxase/mobilization nuclease domain-containing protein [Vagococcus zengguangii]QCI86634.1 relaxase [Vagococcus zengguangii]